MIHLTPAFQAPSDGFILMEGYQSITDGQMTFIGGKLVNKTLTAAQTEKLIKMAIEHKIEIKEERKK